MKINKMMQGDAGSDSVLNQSRWRLLGGGGRGRCTAGAEQMSLHSESSPAGNLALADRPFSLSAGASHHQPPDCINSANLAHAPANFESSAHSRASRAQPERRRCPQ